MGGVLDIKLNNTATSMFDLSVWDICLSYSAISFSPFSHCWQEVTSRLRSPVRRKQPDQHSYVPGSN